MDDCVCLTMSKMEDNSPKTTSKKRKNFSNYKSSSTSSSDDAISYKEKRSKCTESKYKKTYEKEPIENKKLKTSLQDNKYSSEKSFEEVKKEHEKFINQEKDKDKQVELEVWYYLLQHLEESEKLIALKLLVSINKMKKNWKDNFIKNKYVHKKVVDDMKLVIKSLQDEQKKNEAEKQQLMQEKNKLQKKILEERKYRIELAETLANEIEKNNSQSKKQTKKEVPNNIEVSNKADNKQVSQTITETVSKKEPSTWKTSSNDSNNNTQVSKVMGDIKRGKDLRNILNNKENGRIRDKAHRNSIPPSFIRHFPSIMSYSHCAKRTPSNFNDRLCVNIKTQFKYFSDVRKLIETKLKVPIHFNRTISLNDGWKVEFHSLNAKINFWNRRKLLLGTGLVVTNPFW